jgi:hypothetical protein
MTRRSPTFVVLLSTALFSAGCGTGRLVPADTAEPAAQPAEPTPVAAPAPAAEPAAAPQPAPPAGAAYVPYDTAGSLPIRRIGQYSNSGIVTPERLVIRDDSSYARFWARLGAGTRPSVDFTRDVVIAAAAGQRQTGGHSIAVDQVVRSGDGLAVEVVEVAPGPDCMSAQVVTQPVDVVVVAAADAKTWSFTDRTLAAGCR